MLNIADALRLVATRAPSTPAIGVRGGRVLDYAELDQRTNRLANALQGAGLTRGDTVGAWMEDGHEYFELYLAAAKAGLVVVPVNARFKSEEASYALHQAHVSALFFTDGVAAMVDAAIGDADLRLTVTPGNELVAGARPYEQLLDDAASSPPTAARPAADDPYILAFTSGTTGYPKGAVLTHRSVLNVCRSQAIALRIPLYGVRAHTNSMSFTSSVTAHLLPTLYTGGTSILMGKGWTVADLMEAVRTYRVTHTTLPSPVVPDFIDFVGESPDRLGTLQSILHAGSKVDGAVLAQLCRLVGRRFIEGWGMTENSGGLVCATSVGDVTGTGDRAEGPPGGGSVFDTVGRPVAGCDVTIVDDDGQPLPHDGQAVGELVVRSPCLVRGYWENEAATAQAFHDGCYYSGDLGSIDPRGYVKVLDRRADLIVSGGMNVYPAEVERVIKRHEAVGDCAVVGAPHPRWGQTVVAVVVSKPGSRVTDTDVIDHCREHLAGYKKPTAVIFVERLPRNASDKVLRGDLRKLAATTVGDQQ